MRPLKIDYDLCLEERISVVNPMKVIYVRLLGDYRTNDYRAACRCLMDYFCTSDYFVSEMRVHGDANVQSAIYRMFYENIISSLSIYHDDPKTTETEKLRADICLKVPIEMVGNAEVKFKEMEGGKYAVYLYKGPYQNLGSVFDTVYGKYIPQAGYRIDKRQGFEVYLNDPEKTPVEQLLTEIYVPIV